MLSHAGVEHEPVPAEIDEASIKQKLDDPEQVAVELAKAKALAVSANRPGDWVIGSDSIVSVDERQFDKPSNREEAAAHLRFFSGKVMRLTSAVALARAGSVDWAHGETAELEVRPLSESFIRDYLDQEWPAVGGCVGVFRMEGPGAQLFSRVSGSHFTILGMPLLPLLSALRERGVLAS
jgi:nucleoside triphosphate pyrophosphatase